MLSPTADGGRHFAELHEMLAGVWLAEGQAGSRIEGGEEWVEPGWSWQVGESYRLRLALSREAVEGTVATLDGAARARFRFTLTGAVSHVDRGWAGLSASGLDAIFDDVRIEVNEVAEPPGVRATEDYPAYESPADARRSQREATGFFRVEQLDGRWWVIDPQGKPVFIRGTDHCNYRAHWCEKLGYAPYHRNCEALYGSPEPWAEQATARLTSWGFNLLGAGSCEETHYRGIPHTLFASLGSGFATREWIAKPIHWTGFPDVFSPRFEAWCDLTARQLLASNVNDPWIFGTFIDNELEWFGKTGRLVNDVFLLPPDQPAKQALVAYLRERYGSIDKLNQALGTTHDGFEALAADPTAPAASTELETVQSEFLALVAERYFSVTCTALRKADPNHMILGCRFAGVAPDEVLAAAGRWVDIFTINTYPRLDMAAGRVLGTPEMLVDLHAATGRPMMITEWSFPALDSGLPCKGGAGMRVDTQEQKARCYDVFASMIAALPFMVGYDYFMWVDEPELAISSTFPEDSNYGLVDVNDKPWETLVAQATVTNRKASDLHEGARLDTSWVHEAPPRTTVRFGPEQMEARGATRSTESAFSWDLGALQVRHAAGDGAVLSSIDCGDFHLGKLDAALHVVRNGVNAWPHGEREVAVETWTDGELLLADVTVAGGDAATTGAFEATYRLLARRGSPCVCVQVRAVRNTGPAPITVEAYFLYALPSIGGSPEGDDVGGPGGVPNYYLDSTCWTDKTLGGWLGAAPLDAGLFDTMFWKGTGNEAGFHADFRRKVSVTLEPGASWTSDSEPWAAVYGFGPGEPDGWKTMAASDATWKRMLRELAR